MLDFLMKMTSHRMYLSILPRAIAEVVCWFPVNCITKILSHRWKSLASKMHLSTSIIEDSIMVRPWKSQFRGVTLRSVKADADTSLNSKWGQTFSYKPPNSKPASSTSSSNTETNRWYISDSATLGCQKVDYALIVCHHNLLFDMLGNRFPYIYKSR